MTTLLLPRSLLYTSVSAVSLFLLHPSSPLRAPPLQCQYYAPYPVPAQHARPEQSAWTFDPAAEKQGKTSPHRKNGNGGRLLTASTMRQISLGSVLGVLAGLGLRAVSRVLVFAVGVGIVVVEVGPFPFYIYIYYIDVC